ncbi:hypothetical protein FQ775_01055 [Nitratireductor mangrovi]|uniref:Protease n=1 Tax=Nitratireductor mangrovi TaxID=2599600 RepID=A0A5B8KU25_9HYPH|nr:phage protease [Nitratireductor mangrovi]QDY99070.1 hypothetical protein FQ775_01055 [Nitratireductor mangrovi]
MSLAMKDNLKDLLSAASVAALQSPLSAGDAAGSWVRLVPAGRFSARDGRGPFEAGGRAAMEAIVERTRSYHGRNDIVVDYDHQSVFGVKDGVGGTARAAGWIKALEVRQDGIWGRIEWTETAAAAIRSGEYRYLSPVIPHAKDGRIVLIHNVAVTNTPALDLDALAASAKFSPATEDHEMEKILAALGLAKGSGEDAVLAALNAIAASTTAIAKALGLPEDAKPADITRAAEAACADRSKLLEAAGQKPDGKVDDAIAAMKAKTPGGDKSGALDPTKYVPIEQVSALQADLKALKDQVGADKAEEMVEAAMKAGKLAPGLKDWGLDLCKADPAKFEAFVGGAPALTQTQLKTPKKEGDTAVLTAEQSSVAKMLGLDPKDYAETLKAERSTAEELH